jgi:hypothetical protein
MGDMRLDGIVQTFVNGQSNTILCSGIDNTTYDRLGLVTTILAQLDNVLQHNMDSYKIAFAYH